MNWPVIIIVAALLLGLIFFLVRRNVKDEKEIENQLDNDYEKVNKEKHDETVDEIIK